MLVLAFIFTTVLALMLVGLLAAPGNSDQLVVIIISYNRHYNFHVKIVIPYPSLIFIASDYLLQSSSYFTKYFNV